MMSLNPASFAIFIASSGVGCFLVKNPNNFNPILKSYLYEPQKFTKSFGMRRDSLA